MAAARPAPSAAGGTRLAQLRLLQPLAFEQRRCVALRLGRRGALQCSGCVSARAASPKFWGAGRLATHHRHQPLGQNYSLQTALRAPLQQQRRKRQSWSSQKPTPSRESVPAAPALPPCCLLTRRLRSRNRSMSRSTLSPVWAPACCGVIRKEQNWRARPARTTAAGPSRRGKSVRTGGNGRRLERRRAHDPWVWISGYLDLVNFAATRICHARNAPLDAARLLDAQKQCPGRGALPESIRVRSNSRP